MAPQAELCVRCGKNPAKGDYKGIPTCPSCEELLGVSLQAKAEESRTCPVHSIAMSKEIVLNILIDRCPECHGIWLDGGELDLLKKAINAGMPDDFARAMLLPW